MAYQKRNQMKNKDDLTPDNELEKLYELNRHHIAELIFFDDEVKFLKGLLNRYFIEDLLCEHINKSQMIDSRLSQLVFVKTNIARDALVYQGNLQVKFKDINAHNLYFFKLESDRIEEEMKDLNRNFKHIKIEIFQLSKEIMGFEPMVSASNGSLIADI